jgi:hypothetical protein
MTKCFVIWPLSHTRLKMSDSTMLRNTVGRKVQPREAQGGVDGQRHAPAVLLTGKTRYPLYRWLGGPQYRSGRVRKLSPPRGVDPRTVQPVASRYTD